VRVTAVPLSATNGGKTRTLVTMEISYPQAGADLTFDDELRVGILSLSTDGKIKASFQRPITLNGKFKPGARGTFVINETIDLPDGQQLLRVGATSRALGRTGTAHFPIVVPDFRSTDLKLSPIVLGFAGRITDADAVVGLDRVRALVPFQPTTSRVFSPADSLRVFLAGAWRSSATSLDVEVSITGQGAARRTTSSVPATVVQAGGRQARIDQTVAFSALVPGDYVLTVSARAGKEKPVTRALPFVIRPPH
jgi:hypothetical protein